MHAAFWGVRGTFPATGANFARYGGDTMCVEVECGPARIILDAGSGLRALGAKIDQTPGPIRAHIVLSHLHLDHIMGLPHFRPFWREDADIRLWAAEEHVAGDPAASVLAVLRPPFFPVPARSLPAEIGVKAFAIGETWTPAPGVQVTTFALSHQGGSSGIVVEAGGRKLCYVTDHEHGDAEADARLTRAAEGADLLIYDATFTDAEWPARRGWGHSTWEEGIRLKERAGARLLALAHHDPDRTDEALDALSQAAAKRSGDVLFACCGLRISL